MERPIFDRPVLKTSSSRLQLNFLFLQNTGVHTRIFENAAIFIRVVVVLRPGIGRTQSLAPWQFAQAQTLFSPVRDTATCRSNTDNDSGATPKTPTKNVRKKSGSFLKKQTMWDWQTTAKAWNPYFVAKIQNWIMVRGQAVAIWSISDVCMCALHRSRQSTLLINDWSANLVTGNGILDLVTGIWTKFKLGSGIWIGTPFHDLLFLRSHLKIRYRCWPVTMPDAAFKHCDAIKRDYYVIRD